MHLLRSALAATLLCLGCSIGLVATTAAPAAAFIDIDLGKIGEAAKSKVKPVIIGAGKGVVLAGRQTPYGRLFTAGQMAWMAYSSFDSISNYAPGPDTPGTLEEYCAQDPSCVPPGAPGPSVWESTGHKVEFVSSTAHTLTMKVTAKSCPNGCTSFANNFTFTGSNVSPASGQTCTNSGGGTTSYANVPQMTVNLGRTGSGGVLTQTVTLTGFCSGTGQSLAGVQYGRPTNTSQPVVVWGLPPTPYPQGPLTFDEAEVVAKCKNAVTGETAQIKMTSPYGSSGTVVFPSCKQHLGDDWYGTGFVVTPTKPKIDGEPVPEDAPWDVPDFMPDEWDELIPDESDPDWQPCLGTKKGCSLSLWLDDNPLTTRVTTKTLEEILDKQPDRLKCYHGKNVVALKNCYPLIAEHQNTQEGTETTLDPNAPPGTGTETGTGTGTTGGPKNTPDEELTKAECFPNGWGVFNPFEWVYKPVKCALTWAFKPKTEFSVRLDRMRSKFEGKAPFTWIASLNSLPTSVGGGGCPTQWGVTIKGEHYSLICGTPAEGPVKALRPIMLALSLAAAAYPFIRGLVYASTPLVKPTPT